MSKDLDRIVNLIKYYHKAQDNEFYDFTFSKNATLNNLNSWMKRKDCFVKVIDESFIVGCYKNHDFGEDRLGIVLHLMGKKIPVLLKEFETWCKERKCKQIHLCTMYRHDPRLLNYFKRKGFSHAGYSMNKVVQ